MSCVILECDRDCENCDYDEWEKEGYSSEEEYEYSMSESATAMRCFEELEKQAKKEGREITFEERMDVLFFGV